LIARPDRNCASAPPINGCGYRSAYSLRITDPSSRFSQAQSRNCQTPGVSPAKPGVYHFNQRESRSQAAEFLMLRIFIDQDFHHDILRGLQLRLPELDAVTAREAGLERKSKT
jgi:hypothetical protein